MDRPDSRLNDPKLKPLLLVDRIQPPDQVNQYQSSPQSIRYPSPKASSLTNNGPEPHQYQKRSISRSLHAQYALTMDRYIWNGYRRQPNRGTVSLFRLLRPSILSLARKMYGGDGVAVVFGRHKDTAYVLIRLAREPEGAEGHASDEFMALSANFYEVLKDGQAGEADVIAGHDSLKSLKGASLVDLCKCFSFNLSIIKREYIERRLKERLIRFDLPDEIQVQHPISGRLLVGPIEKQKRFMGL
jgi:hypothetical protein